MEQQLAFDSISKTLSKNKVMVHKREDGIYIRLAGKPEAGEYFTLDWVKVHSFFETNTQRYAQRELDILVKSSPNPDNRPLIEPFIPEILSLCEKFGHNGNSGGSAPYVAGALSQAIKKLCLQEPIMPMTGIDDEWVDVAKYGDGTNGSDDILFQNRRCGELFKNRDGRAWYLDAIIWKGNTEGESGNDWDTFSGTVDGIKSHHYVKSFPFTPKKFYIDVTREQLPEDWNEEPFIEVSDWYDTEEYERTGIKNWHKNKYRYHVKDKSQLERVFKYYDRYPDR